MAWSVLLYIQAVLTELTSKVGLSHGKVSIRPHTSYHLPYTIIIFVFQAELGTWPDSTVPNDTLATVPLKNFISTLTNIAPTDLCLGLHDVFIALGLVSSVSSLHTSQKVLRFPGSRPLTGNMRVSERISAASPRGARSAL